jgi:hypothetical protein
MSFLEKSLNKEKKDVTKRDGQKPNYANCLKHIPTSCSLFENFIPLKTLPF